MALARPLLFLVGCVGVRAALAYAAYAAGRAGATAWLRAMAVAALAVAAGFFLIYANGWRTTGPETFGDRIWWNDLRPVHGALYLAFAVLALRGSEAAWIPLAVDVSIGLAAFVLHRTGALG